MSTKSLLVFSLLAATGMTGLSAQEAKSYEIPQLPPTVEQFVQLREDLGKTPEGGALLAVMAMLKLSEDPVEGMKFFTALLSTDGSHLRKTSNGGYKGMEPSAGNQFLINKLKTAPWISWSYIAGTSSKNGYQIPEGPRTVRIIRREDSEQADGTVKLFVISSGADTPRPIRLKRNDKGTWKIAEFSSLFVDVHRPEKPEDDL